MRLILLKKACFMRILIVVRKITMGGLQKQALSTQTIIQELKDQIALLNQEAEKEMETVTSWVEKCGQPDRNVSISESAIIDILNHNKQVEAVLAKKTEADV